jgi:hypothetical protein
VTFVIAGGEAIYGGSTFNGKTDGMLPDLLPRRRPGPGWESRCDAGMRLITSLPQLGPGLRPGGQKAECRSDLKPIDIQRRGAVILTEHSVATKAVIPAQAGIQTRRCCEFIVAVGVSGFPPARE